MEVINLNLIPTGALPVVHASQYDEGRTFRANLMDGSTVYTLDGTETLECDVKKPDGNIVTVAVTNTSDSYVEIDTTLQMCACAGDSLAELHITKGAQEIGTLNFTLAVERSPLEGGIQSDSGIHNLETQVDGMVADVLATQYDSANVVFDDEPTEGHGIPYTVTSEGIGNAIDNALDMTDEASGAIATFDTSLALPLQDCTIAINAVQEEGTPTPSSPKLISGFTGANIKVQSRNWIPLTVSSIKSANQSFTWSDNVGTYHGLTVTLLTDDGITITGIKVNGTANAATNIMTPAYSVQGSYIFNGCVSGGTTGTYYMACRVNGNWLNTARDFGNGVTINGTITQSAITIANGAQITNLVFKPMLRVSTDTDSTYTPYTATTTPISWNSEAGTVYGGSLDVTSGVLTITRGYKTVASNDTVRLFSSLNSNTVRAGIVTSDMKMPTWNNTSEELDIFCNIATPNADALHASANAVEGQCCMYKDGSYPLTVFTLPSSCSTANLALTELVNNGCEYCYPLATPTTVQLTPTQISAIVGTNNIFTDTNGNTTLEYYTKRGEQTVRIAEGVAVDVINNKNIDNLTTTNKTLVGAVNEIDKSLDFQTAKSVKFQMASGRLLIYLYTDDLKQNGMRIDFDSSANIIELSSITNGTTAPTNRITFNHV